MKRIDIHCHVLPGIDDGAIDMKESLHMLKLAARQGVYAVAATSHYSRQFRNEDPKQLRLLREELQRKAQTEIHEDFIVYSGQEIFYTEDIVEKLKGKKLLTLNGSSYVLIEFHPSTPYSMIINAVRELNMAQYMPIIAHFERYASLREQERVEELIQLGALMQMNYRPIGGKWYVETTRWCRKMLKEGNVHFLGTDMHNIGTRKPEITEASHWMDKYLDREYIKDISYRNAERILANEILKGKGLC